MTVVPGSRNSVIKHVIRARFWLIGAALLLVSLAGAACQSKTDQTPLTIYAGRSQTLIEPLLQQFSKDTGIPIKVRYGDGTDLVLGILEEGKNSPADVYLTQDVGALGALQAENRVQKLPQSILDRVPAAFRSPDGNWVGLSGRARVIVYNTDKVDPKKLPSTIFDYTKPEYRNRLAIVPRSDGFPEFITAMRLTKGEAFTKQWLRDLKANAPRTFPNNIAAITAIANGEVEIAFLNHYYLYRFLQEQGEGFKARNYYFDNGDLGGIFLVAGAAILDTAKSKPNAEKFLAYLLEKSAQQYFADNTHEYPLIQGVPPEKNLPALSTLKTPNIDLSDLGDLKGSLELMRQTGIIP